MRARGARCFPDVVPVARSDASADGDALFVEVSRDIFVRHHAEPDVQLTASLKA